MADKFTRDYSKGINNKCVCRNLLLSTLKQDLNEMTNNNFKEIIDEITSLQEANTVHKIFVKMNMIVYSKNDKEENINGKN